MRAESIAIAALLVAVVVLTIGSILTLLTETSTGIRPIAASILLTAALLGAVVFGARFGGWLTSPYW